MTIFEDFLEYVAEDNKDLQNTIKTYLCDYFDLPNRVIPLSQDEYKWIRKNLSWDNQVIILGKGVKGVRYE